MNKPYGQVAYEASSEWLEVTRPDLPAENREKWEDLSPADRLYWAHIARATVEECRQRILEVGINAASVPRSKD